MDAIRNGNLTSSECYPLTAGVKGLTKPAFTYIEEKNMERRMGCAIDTESNAKPLVWGKLLEGRCFNELGLEYSLISQETIVHPEIDYWVGSPDGVKEDTVIDIKCPMTRKSFCQLVQPLYEGCEGKDAMGRVRNDHKDGEKYYWQLVSNSILTGKPYAELIVYMPYLSELPAIKFLADGEPNCYWINYATENELPYIPDNGYYKNINIIRFEVPQEDKDLLTERVKEAGKHLIERPSVIIAENDKEVDAIIVHQEKKNVA
jgi:hypothetical protein